VPWWAKDIKVGFSSINARVETGDKTPAFRDAWKKRLGRARAPSAALEGRKGAS
jgi:putative SOS response-associated peptidase YedK